MRKPTVELYYHVVPVPTTILTLARPNLLETRLFVEHNQSLPAQQRNPLRDARVFDPLHVAFQQDMPQALPCKVRMHTERMQANGFTILVVAGAGCELVVRAEVLGVVHGVICDEGRS